MLKNYFCLFLLLFFSVSKAESFYDGASIQLTLTGALNGSGALGDTITYTFTVTNTGTESVSNITITDGLGLLTQAPISLTVLAPGATDTVTATYSITQYDLDQAVVTNFASAIGFTLQNDMAFDFSDDGVLENGDDNPTTIILTEIPMLSVTVIGNANGAQHAGDPAVVQYQVTNTGNVPLTNVSITDATLMLNIPITALLYPGSVFVMSVQITTTQNEFDQGQILSSPMAMGFTQSNNTVTNSGAPLTIPLTQLPDLTLFDTGVLNANGQVGDTNTFTFTVINTGNVTIENVLINEALTGTVAAVVPSVLAPGQIATYAATYTITQQNIDNCLVTSSASVSGTTLTGVTVNKVSDNGDPADGNNNPTVVFLCPLGTEKPQLDAVASYPNPVAGLLTLTHDQAIDNIQVLSALGQKVIDQKAIGNHSQIDFSELVSGVYFVKVQSGQAEKIIKIIKR